MASTKPTLAPRNCQLPSFASLAFTTIDIPMSLEYLKTASKKLYPNLVRELSVHITKKYDGNTKTFEQLDSWRSKDVPQILAERYRKSKDTTTYLEKKELVLLMDWKLAKGTFRPSLPKLIKSNEEDTVKEVTRSGFKIMLDYFKTLPDDFWDKLTANDRIEYSKTVRLALKKLGELKGIGPATASLLLSCLSDIYPRLAPPFFSDDSFLYFVVGDAARSEYKLRYSPKEYADEYLSVFFDIMHAHAKDGWTMTELERGAWSIGFYDANKETRMVELENPFTDKDVDWNKYRHDDTPAVKEKEEEEEEEEEEEKPKKKMRKTSKR
ncbi:uncharacterized protein LODBEIA_P54450 [Lodderomyces beijingensis]|uniref:HhH-GPD domain-containing protein n=1 Tax=Lodderomyces beijingensis TaxID=1775926 RepID=A0ABP0ZVK9_9ASCO